MVKDIIQIEYKGKKMYIDREILYILGTRLVPAYKDINLTIPFKMKPNFYSKKVELYIPIMDLINYI